MPILLGVEMKIIRIRSLVSLLVLISMLCGCAAERAVSTKRYLWPRPPDEPKIEWIKSYYSQHSFPKSSSETFFESIFGEAPALAFQKPIDIKSNGKGRVFIADIDRRSIVVYDLNNKKVSEWKNNDNASDLGDFAPFYLAVDKNDNVYAVGKGLQQIVVYDSNGRFTRKIEYGNKVKNPGGITLNERLGRIYLVDASGSKVEVFSMSGGHLFTLGKAGENDGELNRPSSVVVNSKGEVIVGDTHNGRIQIFDADGKFLRKFGQRGDGGGNFQIIKGVAVDSDDNIYVTDGKANQFKIFSSKGDYLMSLGAAFSAPMAGKEAPGGFLLPQGIHIDSNDDIFIADQANMRFQIFRYLKGGAAEKGTSLKQERK